MKHIKLFEPENDSMETSHMASFIVYINEQHRLNLKKYSELHQWSIEHLEDFWASLARFCEVDFKTEATTILQNPYNIENAIWFEDATLNFAEHLLRFKKITPEKTALISCTETGASITVSYEELFQQVSALVQALKHLGLEEGDRVVGILPNTTDAVVAMLATTALGATWACCSPDFGLQGLTDRFSQIAPTLLFACDAHIYKGKWFDHREKIAALQKNLPSLKHTIISHYPGHQALDTSHLNNTLEFKKCLSQTHSPLSFKAFPFNHPLYILFSSGTTGKPKCMAHGVGGTLLQHLKELKLHCDIEENKTLFFNTSTGWMMWNWMVSSLALGATLVLYDGAPFHPKPNMLFDLVDRYRINILGVCAKYLESLEHAGLKPEQTHRLLHLDTILTTGSPLLPDSFNYVYRDIKRHVQLSSISGGSDIISCFALANPLLPVYRGELQCVGLGMDVDIFDEKGNSIRQQKGELVCKKPFPSAPIYFWNDPDTQKYHNAYFAKFPGVWAHGDFAEITEHHGMIIYGRSDTTLNPSGIRIGTAEIYQQLESIPEILEGLAVGHANHGAEKIILFVTLNNNAILNDALINKIKKQIRDNTSPYHVPSDIRAVPDLPRTLNGKVAEIAVKKIISGQTIDNLDALANPECLKYFASDAVAKQSP